MPLPDPNLVRRRALQYVADLVHLSPDVVAEVIRTFYKFHQQELAMHALIMAAIYVVPLLVLGIVIK